MMPNRPPKREESQMNVAEYSEIKSESASVATYVGRDVGRVLGDQRSSVELKPEQEYPLAAQWDQVSKAE
jgi:hypothetical protein